MEGIWRVPRRYTPHADLYLSRQRQCEGFTLRENEIRAHARKPTVTGKPFCSPDLLLAIQLTKKRRARQLIWARP